MMLRTRSSLLPHTYRLSRPLAYRFISSSQKTAVSENAVPAGEDAPFYHGPLTRTFRSLKLFSLSSLGLCTSVSPLIYLIDSSMPMSARTGLIAFALTTSSLSTLLVGWIGRPYVGTMRRLTPDAKSSIQGPLQTPSAAEGAVELSTKTVFLQDRLTSVYDPIFLTQTKRAFAKWELADGVVYDTSDAEAVDSKPQRQVGLEEVAAETRDGKGNIKGRWIIKWENGADDPESSTILVGRAREQGKVVRHFNVHEELLES